MDVDLVADLHAEQVDEFCASLKDDFYADPAMMQEALARGRPFNIIHLASSFKVDIFPLGKDPYSVVAFARREFERSQSFGSQPIECAVATREDTILRKLESYRAGGESSERQWNDLRGVLLVSGSSLDLTYLRKWASVLHVEDLLERLLAE